MTTPIQSLYAAAIERREHGAKVMSIEFVINMIEREQTFYKLATQRDEKGVPLSSI